METVEELAAETGTPVRTNWSGNTRYSACEVLRPGSAEEVQALMRRRGPVKAFGSRHSFNTVADTEGTHLDLGALNGMELDRGRGEVTVGAGVTYGVLAPWLDAQGVALANLASLPHISVVGACATGTHGSGLGNGCLTTSVTAVERVTAEGQLQVLRREGDAVRFGMAALGLGALGIVTRLTLAVEPSYQVAQTVYEDLSFDHLRHDLEEVYGTGYSVSLFTDWQGHRATQMWVKRRWRGDGEGESFPATLLGATRQRQKLHPLPGLAAENCTEQMGEPGAWFERLPHFRMDFTPSAGAELQTEYFVPIEQAYEAITAVEALGDRITPHLLISELRVVAADDLPLSMCTGRRSLAIHFTWKREVEQVLALLPAIEEALRPFDARPHWAKLFTMAPERVWALYPQRGRFAQEVQSLDPAGKLQNRWLRELLGEGDRGPGE